MAASRSLVVISIIGGAIVVGGIAGVFFLWRDAPPTEVEEPPPEINPPPMPTLTPVVTQDSPLLAGVTLSTSDEAVRELVRGLSSHPKLVAWLANDDLVRRFTASVENIASGKSPRTHLEFLTPKEKFSVTKKRGDFIVDPKSYERYNLLTAVFSSLDANRVVATYRELRPLINEAYREIAPPGKDFETTLLKAIDQLLRVPAIEGDIYLKEKVVTYVMIDQQLEGMNEAQRHLLRMGPQNLSIIKDKLRELERELRRPVATRSSS